MKIEYNDKWLKNYANALCHKLFYNKGYHGPIHWSSRMRTTGGYFESYIHHNLFTQPTRNYNKYKIVINEHMIMNHPSLLRSIVGHELCHYYDFMTGQPYSERDRSFRHDLKVRHLPVHLTFTDNPKAYLYGCLKCGNVIVQRGKSRNKASCSHCDPHHFDKRYLIRYLGTAQLHGTYNNQTSYQAFVRIGKERLAKLVQPKQLSLFTNE